jgi:hypothetical protein
MSLSEEIDMKKVNLLKCVRQAIELDEEVSFGYDDAKTNAVMWEAVGQLASAIVAASQIGHSEYSEEAVVETYGSVVMKLGVLVNQHCYK